MKPGSINAGMVATRNAAGPVRPGSRDDRRLKEACADFEAIFINFMFQAMKKTLPGDGVFGSSHQKEIYESLFLQEVSTKIAKERGLGIGETLYRQIQKGSR